MHPARIFASLTPGLLAALAVALANLPLSFTGGLLPPPLLGLAVVYFWTLLRPDLMPPFLVLFLGVLEDFLSGGQPGLWAIGYLVAYAVTDRQRDAFAGLSGWGVVIGFSAAMVSAALTVYVAASIVFGGLVPPQPLIVQSVASIILYPLVAVIMGLIYRHIVGVSRTDY
jgi:rod shape-determining protein MreD